MNDLFSDNEIVFDGYYEASDPNITTAVDGISNIPISYSSLNDPLDEQLEILQTDRMHIRVQE